MSITFRFFTQAVMTTCTFQLKKLNCLPKSFRLFASRSLLPIAILLFLVFQLFANQSAAFAQSTVLFGSQSVAASQDSNSSGSAEAFPVTANSTAQLTAVALYVDTPSSAKQITVGIYSNASGKPKLLLTQGSISVIQSGAWNTIPLSPVNVTSGTAYWIALLNTSGTLYFRDATTRGCSSISSAQSNLTALPATWSSGSSWNTCQLSAYGTGTPTAAQPVLSVTPLKLSFSASQGGLNPKPATVSVSNTGTGTLTFTASSDSSWLSVSPASGTAPQSLSVSASLASLTAGSYSGNLSITATGAQGSPQTVAVTFTVSAPPPPGPSLASISPTTAVAGGAAFTLTVNGSSFVSGDTVLWNGSALSTTFVSATQLSAAVSANLITTAGSASVTVQAPGGATSNSTSFTITAAPPSITSISPATAVAGGAAFTLTVNGSNFVSGDAVLWNGSALSTTFVSATQLSAAVPASLVAAAGTASVTVQVPGGATSNSASFTITAATPSITSISPTTAVAGGATFTLTVNGSNFVSGDAVLWNGSALSTTFVSATQLSAAVPASLVAAAGTASVTVQAPGGATSNSTSFTVTAQTYSISGTISGGSGATVTLSGAGLATTADGSGNYSFSGLTNGSYTVTPAETGYTFSPTNQSVTVNNANVTDVNFTVTSHTYSISGTISGGSSATVTLSGATNATTTADGSGNFTFSGLANGSYTVTPSETGFTFTPASQSATISNASVTSVNFTAQAMVQSSGLAIDANVSTAGTKSTTLSSPVFSTVVGNELLLAFIATDYLSGTNTTVTGVSGGGLTWSLVVRSNAQSGTSEIWRAFAPSLLSNVTVTAALSQSVVSSITVISFIGVDSSGTNGSGAIGSSKATSASSGAPTASLTTTRNNSWVFGVGNDYDNAIARTPGPNQTLILDDLSATGDTYWVQRQNFTTPLSGTSVTVNDTAPTSDRYNLAILEILPALSAQLPTFSISGTIAGGSGATLTLSGAANATTTANSSGNYGFSGLANGTYTVTPSESGYTFSPSSTTVTVSGANVTGVTFTATAMTYSVSGTISPAAGGSAATVTLSGRSAATTTTDSGGNYGFSGLVNGSYTITPSNAGYSFTPGNQTVTINGANISSVNFTASVAPATYTISGTISPASAAAGATVTLSGTSSAVTSVDANGNYSFASLSNGSYTITPTSQIATFSPTSQASTISNASVSGVNFTATATANVIFYDDFTGTTLGSAWWIISRHGEYAQDETECNIPQQVSVADSLLTITAAVGPAMCGDFNPDGSVRTAPSSWPYITGDVQWSSLNFTYGTVTIRGAMPAQGTSLWPAFWLLGSNCQNANKYSGDTGFGGCPNLRESGYTEIDMVECYGSGWCQFHLANPSFGIGNGCDATFPVDTNFHVFQTVWTPASIKQYMDGVLETTCNQSPTNPMFLIMQIQTGGAGGTPNNTLLPANLQVDYVKVTQP